MADGLRRLWIGVALTLALVLPACGGQPSFTLDRICTDPPYSATGTTPVPGCRLEGDAQFTSGLTSDTLAVEIGSGGGALTIPVSRLPGAAFSTWSLHVLTASTSPDGSSFESSITWGASCAACPLDPPAVRTTVDGDASWVVVLDGQPGSSAQPIFDDAVATFRGADLFFLELFNPLDEGVYF
jgi:hypothetical protein